jgi:hypothetical protein
MDLLNATKMMAGYTMGVEPSAREHLVVVLKGTLTAHNTGNVAQLRCAVKQTKYSCRERCMTIYQSNQYASHAPGSMT